MATKTVSIKARAREALEFATQQTAHAQNWIELHNALFGIGGKATELFPTPQERTAFSQTDECKQIYGLFDRLPGDRRVGEMAATANGAISVRIPRSVHAALIAEAEAEGISLNQLCLSKLLLQLRALV